MCCRSATRASFDDKNVGTGKPVSVTAIAISGGADAGNYALTGTTASTTADITQRALTVTATGINKVYDGTTAATVTLSDNRVSGDVLTDELHDGSVRGQERRDGKTVSVTGISITGTDAGNYTFNTTTSTTADITARALTVSATGMNKVYDGTTAATVTLVGQPRVRRCVDDGIHECGVRGQERGNGKTVNVSGISISGTDAGNYTVNTTTSTTADITARALTVTATGINKVYDGTTTATVTLSDNRVPGTCCCSATAPASATRTSGRPSRSA